jgi:tetratricopeptide (TPR) repeat protein
MPKFYVHFEEQELGPLPCEITLIVDQPSVPTTAVAGLVHNLLSAYDSAHPSTAAPLAQRGASLARGAGGAPLNPSAPIQSVVKTGDDIWVVPLGETSPLLPPPTVAAEAAAATAATAATARAAKAATPAGQLQPGMLKYLQTVLDDSTKAMQAKNFRAASELHSKIFAIDPTNMQACYQQALVELSVNAHVSATATLERALTARPPPQEPELYVKLGEALCGQGGVENYQAALQHYDTALGLAGASAAYDEDRTDNIKILMAKTLQQAGNVEVALQLVTSVLQRNEQHPQALIMYGAVMTERYAILDVAHTTGSIYTGRSLARLW